MRSGRAGPDGNRNVYAYPNPYDLALDAQWVYKGLIMVYDTNGLPLKQGRFRLTIEPLDNAMTPVSVVNPADLSCTIMIDNTAPSVTIGEIAGPYGTAPACGFLNLDQNGTYLACDGLPRIKLAGMVTVPFTVNDPERHIWQILVVADYGDVCDTAITMQTLSYTDTSLVPTSQRPSWQGGSYSASSNGRSVGDSFCWDQCAHEFSVDVYKRVTNGEHAHYHWIFTKHVTLMARTATT
ncbi:MAG: hypothetical protein EOM91_18195 [Sphingobacteriia bacterium]|nr:hypothetical protein [Sphingobacteriia bacterium]NCC40875.1 hypothetical protein [Gammaproteobacteria bacterium]